MTTFHQCQSQLAPLFGEAPNWAKETFIDIGARVIRVIEGFR